MASTGNAFAMLLGAGENAGTATNKKKRSTKKKAAVAEEAAPEPEAHVAAHVAAVAPVNASDATVDATEACAIVERAAREAKTMPQKTKLWKEWIRQTHNGKLKYKAGIEELDFKQMLLRSNAIEITVEGSMTSGLAHEHAEPLSQLFSVFMPHASPTLSSALIRLAVLLVDEAPDTLGAAQRAARSVVSKLKTPDAGSGQGSQVSWVDQIEGAEKNIVKQQTMLQKMAASSGGVVSREQLNCAKTIYKLSGDKFDLLLSTPTSKPGGSSSADKAIADLQAVIQSHLREAAALEDSAKVKANSVEAQRVQALSAYRREESIVASELAEVAAQVRTLEAQLNALRSRQSELDDKRAQLQQRSRKVVDSMGSRGAAGLMGAAHFREQAASVDALASALAPGAGVSPAAVSAVQASQANAPLEYLSAGHQYLTLSLSTLSELPTKLNFCKQRVAHAEKLARLVSDGSAVRQKEEAERLLAEHLRTADDVERAACAIAAELNARYEAVVAACPAHAGAAADALRAVDALTAQIRAAHGGVLAAAAAPLAEPAAPPPGATNGSHRGGRNARGAASAAAAAADATPVPVPVPQPVLVPVAVAPAAARVPARGWGVVATAAPADDNDDDALPTPAEAFAARAAAGTSADGFVAAPSSKKNRKPKA